MAGGRCEPTVALSVRALSRERHRRPILLAMADFRPHTAFLASNLPAPGATTSASHRYFSQLESNSRSFGCANSISSHDTIWANAVNTGFGEKRVNCCRAHHAPQDFSARHLVPKLCFGNPLLRISVSRSLQVYEIREAKQSFL